MTEEKERRSSLLRTTLLISVISSLLVSSIVYFAANRYITFGDTAQGRNQDGSGLQMSATGSRISAEGNPMLDQTQPGAQQLSTVDGIIGTAPAAQVARKASAGVVGITVERVAQQNNLFNDGKHITEVGSGVIVSSDGYILTNNHVAGGKSKSIVVSLADGRNVDGVVAWADPVLDLAVVKINLTGLTPLTLGDASKLEVGEPAIAIGNPLGLEFQRSVTSGIISALNRTIRIDNEGGGSNYMEDLIQTDASINPGNSGGPLLNANGEVIGINTVKVTSAEGMGFAIPINISKPITQKLIRTGAFEEPYLGLFAYDSSLIPFMSGMPNIKSGVYVAHLDTKGPAYASGIREGCIIRQIDGVDINTMLQLRTYIYTKAPGDTINITHLMHGSNKWTTTGATLARKERDGLITR